MKRRERCCFCRCRVEGIGHNPWPVEKREGAVCCDWCDSTIVFVARLRELMKEDEEMD